MDEFFDLPTLIVIGLAIVILFRLRSVLGTRTGNERSPLERRSEAPAKAGDDTVIQMRPRPVETPTDEQAERQARRLATAEDVGRAKELRGAHDEDARRRALERVRAHGLRMKLSAAEGQWDRK